MTTTSERDFSALEHYRDLIDDWQAFTDTLSRPLPVSVWTNTLRITPEALQARAAASGLTLRGLPWSSAGFRFADATIRPGNRLEYLTGLYHVQEEVSQLPVMLAGLAPGMRVLDMCAAPGNKTVLAAVHMRNRGTLVANDVNWGRMRAIRGHLDRLGIVNVSTTLHDGRTFPEQEQLFDRVFVDAPCSCEGTSRKTKGILGRDHDHHFLARAQRALLFRAVELCAVGGRVIYSTCTYAPQENEMVVDALLSYHGEALAVPEARLAHLRSAPGLTAIGPRALDPRLEGAMRIWPHHNDTGGFFVCLIDKLAPTATEAS